MMGDTVWINVSGALEAIPADVWGLPVGGITTSALLGLAILMLFRGDLVTRREYAEKVKECDFLREAHRISEEGRLEQGRQQLDVTLELADSVRAVMNGLRDAAGIPPRGSAG